jgi:hypothetical protein
MGTHSLWVRGEGRVRHRDRHGHGAIPTGSPGPGHFSRAGGPRPGIRRGSASHSGADTPVADGIRREFRPGDPV